MSELCRNVGADHLLPLTALPKTAETKANARKMSLAEYITLLSEFRGRLWKSEGVGSYLPWFYTILNIPMI